MQDLVFITPLALLVIFLEKLHETDLCCEGFGFVVVSLVTLKMLSMMPWP